MADERESSSSKRRSWSRSICSDSSIGSFVAQEIALTRSPLIGKVVSRLIGLHRVPPGMHGWAGDILEAVGGPQVAPEGVLHVFFPVDTSTSKAAGLEFLKRLGERSSGPGMDPHDLGYAQRPIRRGPQVGAYPI